MKIKLNSSAFILAWSFLFSYITQIRDTVVLEMEDKDKDEDEDEDEETEGEWLPWLLRCCYIVAMVTSMDTHDCYGNFHGYA